MLVPGAARVAVLVNPATATITERTLRDLEPAARAMGLHVRILNASTSQEISATFATFERERPDAVLVGLDPFFAGRRVQLVHLATRYAVPAAYTVRDFAEAGGLISYGASIVDAWRQVGVYCAVSLRVPSLRSCPSSNRRNSSWLSMLRRRGCSASPCRRRCSPSPTR